MKTILDVLLSRLLIKAFVALRAARPGFVRPRPSGVPRVETRAEAKDLETAELAALVSRR